MKSSVIFFIVLTVSLFSCKKNNSDISKTDAHIDKKIDEICQQINEPSIPANMINLCEFAGKQADENGTYNFYNAIKEAIDSLSKMGGGKLLFPHSQGKDAWIKQTEIFRVKGPIHLENNIELTFHPNTKLFFEFSPENYLPDNKPVLRRYEGTSLYTFSPLIYAFNKKNIAITFAGGNGALPVIDGDGEKWQNWSYQGDLRVISEGKTPAYKAIRTELNEKDLPIGKRICIDLNYHYLRPAMIELIHCQQILIDGVKLKESPFWVVHPVFCQQMTMRNVMYDCHVVNNDGIDIESSKFILVENVIFDNHDDNIVIKSGINREGREGALVAGSDYEKIKSPFVKDGRITAATENIVARNCIFKGHYGFCIGSESSGGANNIYITNCYAPMEVSMGVFLKSSRKRGGLIENIYIRNIDINYSENDVICLIPNYDNDTTSMFPPTFKNIYISNISAKNAGNGIRIHGWEDALIKNIRLNNINITNVKSELPKDILLINQVENVILKNVTIENKNYNNTYNKKEKEKTPPRQG